MKRNRIDIYHQQMLKKKENLNLNWKLISKSSLSLFFYILVILVSLTGENIGIDAQIISDNPSYSPPGYSSSYSPPGYSPSIDTLISPPPADQQESMPPVSPPQSPVLVPAPSYGDGYVAIVNNMQDTPLMSKGEYSSNPVSIPPESSSPTVEQAILNVEGGEQFGRPSLTWTWSWSKDRRWRRRRRRRGGRHRDWRRW